MSDSRQQILEPLPLDERLVCCPVCGCGEWAAAFLPDIARCTKCRTLFREPRPTQEVIAASYNSGHTYSEWQTRGESWKALWQRRVAYVKRLRLGGSLLDIGIGDASFLRQIHAAGYDVEGTELSETGAGYARELGLNVRVGQFTDLPFQEESFDIVTMWHVLEHVPNPQRVVRKVFALLRPGGLFVIAVPNETHPLLRHRLWPWRFPRAFEPLVCGGEIHLTHFTPSTIKAFLQREGFQIARFEVDDFYPNRAARDRLKFWVQQTAARLLGWHCAVAMQLVCHKPRDASSRNQFSSIPSIR
jgi:2-polyprenyl-3-methyl-5-hydroxy-6-metoxy-1,4-benzoquinol methylase